MRAVMMACVALAMAGGVAHAQERAASAPARLEGSAVVVARVPAAPVDRETVPPAPAAGRVWVPGHWHWDGNRLLWEAGQWRAPEIVDTQWEAPRWVPRGSEWEFVPGRWVSVPQPAWEYGESRRDRELSEPGHGRWWRDAYPGGWGWRR